MPLSRDISCGLRWKNGVALRNETLLTCFRSFCQALQLQGIQATRIVLCLRPRLNLKLEDPVFSASGACRRCATKLAKIREPQRRTAQLVPQHVLAVLGREVLKSLEGFVLRCCLSVWMYSEPCVLSTGERVEVSFERNAGREQCLMRRVPRP